ncbi:acyltransferase [Candidatus Daviesbacteria bacterium]|nr:acyltransferase [Candidatus Daviesbacteria bacterium]
MQIKVGDPSGQTLIFGVLFLVCLILTARKLKNIPFFSSELTRELKGFAILAIIFSHIGYFLSADHRFLYPFSILAGVGVNLFLFWSGFGLASSALRSDTSVLEFYKKRLKRLFIPLWFVLTSLFLADLLFLNRAYPFYEIIQSYLGFYPKADIWQSLNSPLWYFSLIFFYYLIFPLTFWRKFPYLCPVVILALSYFVMNLPLSLNPGVLSLYKIHSLSFPLGLMFALLTPDLSKLSQKTYLKFFLLTVFLITAAYTSINSGVGLDKNTEQTISLITMFSIIFVFMLKNVEFRLFTYFGSFSYIIYLIHWPILSRYDIFYKYLPASLATMLYLGLFLAIGYVFAKIESFFSNLHNR